MWNIFSAVCFLVFVATGLTVAFTRRFAPSLIHRILTNTFIGVVLAISFAAGLAQRDMWPFSSWTMMVGLTPPATKSLPSLRIMGVDATADEHDIDYRAWRPLSLEELFSWINHNFFNLDPGSQDRVACFLLQLSNRARERALSEGGLEFYLSLLGPLRAPTHILHPPIWNRSASVPKRPFTRLRIYKENWNLQVPGGSLPNVSRVLIYEYVQR
jgi:hypothetical protein